MGRFEPDKGLGGAVVADTEPDPDPEPELGRIWFNTSADNGVEMFVADTDEWIMVGVIPQGPAGNRVSNAVPGPADQASDVAKKRVRLARLEKFNSFNGISQEAFVDDTDPDSNPDLGAIWFDTSPGEGVDVHVADETGWTAVGRLLYLSAIAPSVSLSVDGDDVATEGDEVEFAVRSSNVDSWEIDYTGDGSIDASGSESPPATLSEEYSSPGTYTATFTARNDAGMKVTAETEITVVEPADFEIVGINGPETIQEGATAEFTATIENPGLAPNEEEVELEIEEFVDQSSSWWYSNYHAVNDRIEDSKQVHLAGEETKEITLEWDDPNRLSSGDTHRASVRTESDEMMITGIDIDDPVFEVLDVDYPQRVDIGESAEISATVSNGSSSSPAQGIVELEIGGSTQSKSVRIGGMERTEVVFEWGGKNDPGVYDLAVNVPRSYLGYTGSTIIVGNSGRFEIEDIGGPYVVEAGDDVTVTATVRNIGSVETTQDIRLEVDGSLEDSERVRLDGGSEDATTLTWSTSSGDSGSAVTEYDLTVSSDDDSDSATVYVREPANFQVNILSVDTPIVADETLKATAEITNTGDVEDTQVINATAGSLGDSERVTLPDENGSKSTVEEFSISTSTDDAGSYVLEVTSDDDDDTEFIEILKEAFFEVEIENTNTPVQLYDEIEVAASITNTGGTAGEQNVSLHVDDVGGDLNSVELSAGDSTREQFKIEARPPEEGNYTATVSSDNDDDVSVIEIEGGLAITSVDCDTSLYYTSGMWRAMVDVSATVENTGNEDASADVTIWYGSSRDARDDNTHEERVTIEGNGSTKVENQFDVYVRHASPNNPPVIGDVGCGAELENEVDGIVTEGEPEVSITGYDVWYDQRVNYTVEITNVGGMSIDDGTLAYYPSSQKANGNTLNYQLDSGETIEKRVSVEPTADHYEDEIHASSGGSSDSKEVSTALGYQTWREHVPETRGSLNKIKARDLNHPDGDQILDVRQERTHDGVIVDVYRDKNGSNQQWYLKEPEDNFRHDNYADNIYEIEARHSGKVLDIGYHDGDRTLIQNSRVSTRNHQRWRLYSAQYGWDDQEEYNIYIIQNVATDEIIEYAPDSNSSQHLKMQLVDPDSAGSTVWEINDA